MYICNLDRGQCARVTGHNGQSPCTTTGTPHGDIQPRVDSSSSWLASARTGSGEIGTVIPPGPAFHD